VTARGFFIVLEGVDGAGKTTQARLLARALEDRGLEVLLTQEPTRGPYGQKLRQYLAGVHRHLSPEEELKLFLADRREHVREVIEPALAAGVIVISDRYYYSTAAYQGALGLDPARILALNEAFAPRPDLVLILTLPLKEALTRLAQSRPGARQVSENPAYLERVAAIYGGLAEPQIRRVDASAPLKTTHAILLRLTLEALKG
jgi:dTMP kinase